jgi:quercetin dioxygenase-like cupin family protein
VPSDHRIFAESATIEAVRVGGVEGKPTEGVADLKHLLQGDDALLIEITFEKGMEAPPHSHSHESYCYCVKGRIKSTVDGTSYVLGPGDSVFHPADVTHSTEVLEDSVWLEFKTPPERTW